jgi:photosystem II stability/assembly factor-like uncharacterized protein
MHRVASYGQGHQFLEAAMGRRVGHVPAALAAAALVAGCASSPSHVTTPSSQAHQALRPTGLLQGKFQALAFVSPGRRVGIASFLGFPGGSTTVWSWIARTSDGGRHWTAGPPARGQRQPGAQSGLAFTSTRQGWAYEPGLFFTRDGGATWRSERTSFPLVGPVVVAGTSTWVVGYPCTRGNCPATIYTVGRVGGVLRQLPVQPTTTGSVVVMRRPTPAVAWLLLAGRHGRTWLETTSDAGKSWATRALPCPASERVGYQLSAAGADSLWMVCQGTPAAGTVRGAIYRTTDGARTWMRAAAEYSLQVYAVNDRVAWAVEGDASNSLVVRTTDGGRTWRTVLRRPDTYVQAFTAAGADAAQAITPVFRANGLRFVAYRTTNAGRTWQRTALPA